MASRVIVFTKLNDGVDAAQYEKWVRTVDYPVARRQEPILSYEVYRANQRLLADSSESPYDYVEVIDVADVEKYLEAAGSEDMQSMLAEWGEHIAEFVAITTDVVD
jgi:hypothetical protein